MILGAPFRGNVDLTDLRSNIVPSPEATDLRKVSEDVKNIRSKRRLFLTVGPHESKVFGLGSTAVANTLSRLSLSLL